MTKIFEVGMLLCFGAAWPTSVITSYRARTAVGKSLTFLLTIFVGYICGVINKLINGVDYVLAFYFVNMIFVGTDIVLYFRNKRLDKMRAEGKEVK